jgi:hypothetical protein
VNRDVARPNVRLIFETFWLSVADTLTGTVPLTVLLARGFWIATVGATVSLATVTAIVPEDAELPAAS